MDTTIIAKSGSHRILNKPSLEALDNATLLAVYNKLTGKNTTKFASREKGLEQVWKALTAAQDAKTLPSQIDLTSGAKSADVKPVSEAAKNAASAAYDKEVARATGKPASTSVSKPAAKNKAEAAPKGKRTVIHKERGLSFNLPIGDEQKHPRLGKRLKIFELLTRPEGASFEEVQKATGWDRKTAYEGIRLLHSYCGYGLKQDKEGRIHIVGA